jgi:hypothetical protein
VDDRDKDLTHLFVRDLDEIPLPARGVWRLAPGKGSFAMRASRGLLAAGAVAAVLAVALIVGLQLGQRQQTAATPSATPTASATASASPVTLPGFGPTALPSTTPTSSPAGGYNDDFGFVLTEPGAGRTTTIRRESGARLGSFDQQQFAVSPDGRQIAWFTPESAQPQELRIATAADLTRSQLLRTLNADERGATIVWSNDASGLLYTVHGPDIPTGVVPSSAATYAVHTFDMRGTTTPDRVVLTSPIGGLVFVPIAWDRTTNVAAALETGEGGYMTSWDVIRFNGTEAVTTKTAVVPNGSMLASVEASSDAKLVVGGSFAGGGSLVWWPLADFGARQTVPGGMNGHWRPQTHELATVGGCAGDPACGPNGGLRLINVDTGASRIAYGLTIANMNLRTFRADGSAVIVYAPQAPGANMSDYTLVPLTGGSPITFREVNGLLASVRLR